MKTMNILLYLFFGSLLACEKPPPMSIDSPIEQKDTIFEILWATRHYSEGSVVSLNNGLIYKDWYLYSGDENNPFSIFAYNVNTGDKDWEYVNEGVVRDEIDLSKVIDNIYIGICSKGIVGIDLDTRQMLWEIDFVTLDFYRGRSRELFKGYLYHEVSKNGAGLNSTSIAFIKIDVNTGEFEEIFESKNDAQGHKSFSPPAFWEDQENDGRALMIFNEYPNAEVPPEEDIQNIMAIDLETREVVWKTENFTENFYSNSLHPPIIYNDIVITGGDWSIYAFDVRTGEQLWRRQIPGYDKFGIFATTNHLIHDDRLYVNDTGDNVTCINPETGDIIWNSTDAPNCTDNMVYYQDMLVFTSWGYGSVMVLDALTGRTIHREHRYDDSSYNNDVVYDPETDMFFTSTYKHAIGFKIHKPE